MRLRVSRLLGVRLLAIAGLAAVFELACRGGLITPYTMIPPSQMVMALGQILFRGGLTADMLGTLGAIAAAVSAAIAAGIAVAVVLHAVPRARRAVDPILATYYAIPIFVFYPLFIVLFGLNDVPKFIIGFMLGVVTVIASTLNGLDRVPAVLRRSARVMHLSRSATVRFVVLPSAAPHIFNGIKLAFAHSFVGVLGAEFILATGGLGYQISYAFHDFDNRRMYGLMLFVLLVVAAVNTLLFGWERQMRRRRGLA